MKPTHKNMPSRERITRYWVNNHRDHPESLPWWNREPYYEHQIPEDCKWCFACKKSYHSVDRAHILPLSSGGGNGCENLHLLCHSCHKESEHLSGEVYWVWIKSRRWWHVHTQAMVERGIITASEKSVVVMYFDACVSNDKAIIEALEHKMEPVSDKMWAWTKASVDRQEKRRELYLDEVNRQDSGSFQLKDRHEQAVELLGEACVKRIIEDARRHGPHHHSPEEVDEFQLSLIHI